MIPSNPALYEITAENKSLKGPFQYPDSIATNSELTDYELGGVAFQDPSQGLTFQTWTGYWQPSDSTAYLYSESAPTPQAIFTTPSVEEFTFTFDQNMRWAAATRVGTTAEFRWYDSAVEAYVTTTYTGITSVRLAHDDKRAAQVQLGSSDMILTYIRAGQVRWRIQRDRFLTEYSHPTLYSGSLRISHFGMNNKNRLQWRIGPRRINM